MCAVKCSLRSSACCLLPVQNCHHKKRPAGFRGCRERALSPSVHWLSPTARAVQVSVVVLAAASRLSLAACLVLAAGRWPLGAGGWARDQ